jgi:transposase-like protein
MKKIDLPKDENNKLYWIPVVVKNKDYLVGFIESFKSMAVIYEIPLTELDKMFCSDRFNDIMKDGIRIQDLTRNELKEKVKNIILQADRSEHIENDTDLYENNYLTIDCPHCGMFYSFSEIEDIPNENFKCQTCGKTILFYTNLNDDEIEYEGKRSDVLEQVVQEIHRELFKSEDEEQ